MIENAIIKDARVFVEDHGILTSFVDVSYGGGSGQGFGGYDLRSDNRLAMWHLELFKVFGATDLRDLGGRPCRVEVEGGLIRRIGHYIENRWFDPKEMFK